MASSYTDSLGLEKQGSGENANTWGQRLNSNVIDLVDEAVAGYATVALTSGTQTDLTIADGSSSTGRHATLEFTGDVAATVTVTIPTEQKTYAVINSVTNGGKVLVVNTGSSVGAGKIIPAGQTALLASNGSQVKTIGGEFESGTRMAFAQAAAPTGWTVETCATYDNAALRIINASTSGTGGGTAGSNDFNAAFNTAISVIISGNTDAATGNTGSTTLTLSQIPAHNHTVSTNLVVAQTDTQRVTDPPTVDGGKFPIATQPTFATGNAGGGGGHTHTLGSHTHNVSIAGSFNLNPKYVNFIVCTKD